MNATQVSPSGSIEASLLSFNNAPPQSPTFNHSPVQHSSQDSSRALSPQTLVHPHPTEQTEHQSTRPVEPSLEMPPPSADNPGPQIDGQDHDRMVMDNDGTDDVDVPVSSDLPRIPASPPPPPEPASSEEPPSINPQVLPPDQQPLTLVPVEGTDQAPLQRTLTQSTTERNSEDGDEIDSDDESYNGDVEFLTQLKEDNSNPSDDELREIEAAGTERSGSDHTIWESAVFGSLDDPEYTFGESGRITWTVNGFHGTKESPNRHRIMRSPVVVIGGYKWNLKLFPHGNEGTDQLSVYIECTGEASETVSEQDADMQDTPTQETSNPLQAENEAKSPLESASTQSATEHCLPWEVAAQIGCVMYNPQEPRVNVFEKATHQFENTSQDWGWVRYHGPWNNIHQRRHMQRGPMLQNDTLAFTAYIRTVNDPTRALWWRPVNQVAWDSLKKTGHRGLTADDPAGNAFVAALAQWIHLTPFKNLVLETEVPNSVKDPRRRIRPLFENLQDVIYDKYSPGESSTPPTLYQVERTFDWYEHQFAASTDVIEVWESIRNILNQEYWDNEIEGSQPDVLAFIKTIRQNWRPALPPPDVDLSRPEEPHSVQEVVDAAAADGQTDYKNWEGWHQSGTGSGDILQIELHRQRYDSYARKWKRLTHKIKMNDTIVCNQTEYKLVGMVIHKGELGTSRYYSIVRPGGTGCRWARYKSGHVTYLTHRQAVESHEGKGDFREGTESVAYTVTYVRSSSIEQLCPLPEARKGTKVLGPLDPPKAHIFEDLAQTNQVPVAVYDSSTFENYSDVGFIDPWKTESDGIYSFEVGLSTTLEDIQRLLIEKYEVASKPEQCRLWPLKTTTSSQKFAPRVQEYSLQTKLSEFAIRFGGVHIWLQLIPVDELVAEPPAPPKPFPIPLPDFSQDSNAFASMPPPPNMFASMSPPPPAVGLTPGEIRLATELSSRSNTDESAETPPPNPEIVPADVVMGGTQEGTDAVDGVPEPAASEVQSPEPVPQRLATWQKSGEIYIFVKLFDPVTQNLSGKGAYFTPQNRQISEFLKENNLFTESFTLHHEMDSLLDEPDISSQLTFTAAGFYSGSILIIANTGIQPADAERIIASGENMTAPDYYHSMSFLSHFAYQGSHHVESYYGGAYTYAPLRNGRPFGECTMVDDTTGDAYVGNCTNGIKSGQGTMYYANGDTYTGDWANSHPDGQGTMVYHTTNNRYVGGFKAGRRHGKGVMTYEVADEEMALCKICYESEMDALFYRCGHVAACENCARQVRDCPVCRRPVDAVVRIWKT